MKKTLNEQVFLIKQMMGKLNEGEIYKSSSEEHDDYLNELKTVEGTTKYLMRVSEKVEFIAEDLWNHYKGTEFWHYIKPLYSGLKSISDLERRHTRTDQREENISYAIEFIKSGFGEDQSEEDDETLNLNEALSGTPKMEKGKDYYGVSTKDGQKYLIKVLETTGLMGDCNVFFGETLIAKGYSMFVGGNFNTPSGVWAFKDPQMKSKYGDFKVTSTSNL
jgi:hypothetical protein